jgi:hypothetical protein
MGSLGFLPFDPGGSVLGSTGVCRHGPVFSGASPLLPALFRALFSAGFPGVLAWRIKRGEGTQQAIHAEIRGKTAGFGVVGSPAARSDAPRARP